MSDAETLSPQELLSSRFVERNPDIFPIAVVVMVDGINADGERILLTWRDTEAPVWQHLGMLHSAVGDMNSYLQEEEEA